MFAAVLLLCAMPVDDSIDALARAHIAKHKIPGAVVVAVRDSAVVYARGFGVASTETREPMTPDHLIRVGSTTKMMVAASALKLAEQGKLSVTAPVGQYVKGLDPAVAKLTLHQLLSHTAGLMDRAPMYGPQDDAALLASVLEWKAADMFFTSPGSVYSYSNPGYVLSGVVIEAASGMAFADAVAELIFKPAGMVRTTFRPTMAMTWPLAQGHDGQAVTRPAANNSATWPAGSMFTSGRDFARFAIALLNGGVVDGKAVLSPAIVKQMSSPHVTTPGAVGGKFYGYGLGSDPEFDVVEHGGSRQGYTSHLMLHPKRKLGVIVLTNRSGGNAADLAHDAMAALSGVKVPPQRLPAAQSKDLSSYAGVYRNGPNAIEVSSKGSSAKLSVTQAGKTQEYEAGAGNCFAHEASTLCFSAGKFLHAGGRSYARQ